MKQKEDLIILIGFIKSETKKKENKHKSNKLKPKYTDTVMSTETKQKQIVVNVTAEAKAKINSLKETLNVSDKEFVDSVLVVLENTADDVIKSAVETVVREKQAAKIAAKIAKIEAQLAAAKAEA